MPCARGAGASFYSVPAAPGKGAILHFMLRDDERSLPPVSTGNARQDGTGCLFLHQENQVRYIVGAGIGPEASEHRRDVGTRGDSITGPVLASRSCRFSSKVAPHMAGQPAR